MTARARVLTAGLVLGLLLGLPLAAARPADAADAQLDFYSSQLKKKVAEIKRLEREVQRLKEANRGLKAELAALHPQEGGPPPEGSGPYMHLGRPRSQEWFDRMYDEFGHRMARVDGEYVDIGWQLWRCARQLEARQEEQRKEAAGADAAPAPPALVLPSGWESADAPQGPRVIRIHIPLVTAVTFSGLAGNMHRRMQTEGIGHFFVSQVLNESEVVVVYRAEGTGDFAAGQIQRLCRKLSLGEGGLLHVRGLDTAGLTEDDSLQGLALVEAGTYEHKDAQGAPLTIPSYMVHERLTQRQFAEALRGGLLLFRWVKNEEGLTKARSGE